MSVNDLPLRGYGSFGSIPDVVLRGYYDAAAITAAVGGTVSVTEAQVVAGGETTTITLTNDTWAATLGDDNSITDAFIAGVTADGAEAGGWNNTVRDASLTFDDITRTSDTVATIVWPATAAYDVTADETVTFTLDATTLVTSSSDVVASGELDIIAAAETTETTPEHLGGGAYVGGQRRRKKRKQDDDDLMEIVLLSMPEILKYLKK